MLLYATGKTGNFPVILIGQGRNISIIWYSLPGPTIKEEYVYTLDFTSKTCSFHTFHIKKVSDAILFYIFIQSNFCY